MAAQASGLHSLATIIKRLEAATSRIEDIVASQGPGALAAGSSAVAVVASSEKTGVPPPLPPPPPPPSALAMQTAAADSDGPRNPAIPPTPPSIAAFDELVYEGKVKPFVELSKNFGGPSVIELSALVENQYDVLRTLLRGAAYCQKPDQKIMDGLLNGLEATITALPRAKETHRRDRDWFTHLTLMCEGGPAIGWVVNPKPAPYIAEIKDSVAYYGNKVIKEFKDKSPQHIEWVRAYTGILDEMRKWVQEYHPTGLVWNAKGLPYDQFTTISSVSPPPAPPPPPPASSTSSAPSGGAAAVFAEINRGEDVTKGLRKVDKSEMTHKNPTLRASSVVPASASSPALSPGKKPIKPTKPSALAGKKPSRFVLEGNKWLIEYQENESGLTVENVEISQSVYIFGCKNSTIIIKGKVNAVTILNSVKTSVLVESVVSSISVTASPSFALQVTGVAPMIQLDNTDSGQIYISKDSLGVEITTAKCSSINVSIPEEGAEEGIFQEQAVPEMLKTVVKDGKLVTTVVEHVG